MNSQNSMENSGFIGTSQMMEYDNNKPNSMAKFIDKKFKMIWKDSILIIL